MVEWHPYVMPHGIKKGIRQHRTGLFLGVLLLLMMGCGNGQPVLQLVDVRALEGEHLTIGISLSHPAAENVTVAYETRPLNALKDVDYPSQQGTLNFPAGSRHATISLKLNDDLLYSGERAFALLFADLVNAQFQRQDGASVSLLVVTIEDDEPRPVATFSSAGQRVTEGVRSVNVSIVVDRISREPFPLSLSVAGSADRISDYMLMAERPLVVPAGESKVDLKLVVRDDDRAECRESVVLMLGPEANRSARLDIEIIDDDIAGKWLQVGADKPLKLPSDAARTARSGDGVEFSEERYRGDVAVWPQNDLLLCGLGDGVELHAAGYAAEEKAIWVIRGDRVTVENIEFYGAAVDDRNGAGIRAEGRDLTVRYSRFTDNQNGILSVNREDGTLLVEHSLFTENGAGDGLSHNIYVGRSARLDLRFNTFIGARAGHNIKSRARFNMITYNQVMDAAAGNASYQIDLPDGGTAYVIGNVIQQGVAAENWTLLAYGLEGIDGVAQNRLHLINNTFVNDRDSGMFLKLASGVQLQSRNNIFAGQGELPLEAEQDNLVALAPAFVDRAGYDYRLTSKDDAIDSGVMLGEVDGIALLPVYEYDGSRVYDRHVIGAQIDMGAFEFGSDRQ